MALKVKALLDFLEATNSGGISIVSTVEKPTFILTWCSILYELHRVFHFMLASHAKVKPSSPVEQCLQSGRVPPIFLRSAQIFLPFQRAPVFLQHIGQHSFPATTYLRLYVFMLGD